MMVYDSPLVLVNSHLSAGDKEGDEQWRNSDVAEILKRCGFSQQVDVGTMAAPTAALVSECDWVLRTMAGRTALYVYWDADRLECTVVPAGMG